MVTENLERELCGHKTITWQIYVATNLLTYRKTSHKAWVIMVLRLEKPEDHPMYRHGHSRKGMVHPLYHCWMNMKRRCENSKNAAYKNYGGRGIRIRWNSFDEFLADMGPSWKGKGWTIHRVDNDGDYCKENCVWATRSTQAYFRRPKSEEHKRRLSESVKRLGLHSEEHKQKIAEGLKAAYERQPRGAEVYEKIAKSLTGRHLSDEHKRSLSEAKQGIHRSPEKLEKLRMGQQRRRLREREERDAGLIAKTPNPTVA